MLVHVCLVLGFEMGVLSIRFPRPSIQRSVCLCVECFVSAAEKRRDSRTTRQADIICRYCGIDGLYASRLTSIGANRWCGAA
ncbi:hypothetical protein BC629DRAFT_307722 [Irpex lacteus]|nr:hypothetical protein BC629DRAFT_307722 [Irpex lacteus]